MSKKSKKEQRIHVNRYARQSKADSIKAKMDAAGTKTAEKEKREKTPERPYVHRYETPWQREPNSHPTAYDPITGTYRR